MTKSHLIVVYSLLLLSLSRVLPFSFTLDFSQSRRGLPYTSCLKSHSNDDDFESLKYQPSQSSSSTSSSRRDWLSSIVLTSLIHNSSKALAADADESPSSSSEISTTTSYQYPPITHKVYLDIRISRADGTFYIRDDIDNTNPNNQVFQGQIILGLFGTYKPVHVSRFLEFANSDPIDSFSSSSSSSSSSNTDKPSYASSSFQSLDQSTGLLNGGYIPSLKVSSFGGSAALEYKGRLYGPAKYWIEDTTSTTKSSSSSSDNKGIVISHNVERGLLTHRNLDIMPSFGITTRPTPLLDSTHTVFGRVLPTSTSKEFLDRVIDLPTYSMDRPLGSAVTTTTATIDATATTKEGGYSPDDRALQEFASSVYSFQKEFFRGAAKTFGDTRIDNVYEGKLLRKVEIRKVVVEDMKIIS